MQNALKEKTVERWVPAKSPPDKLQLNYSKHALYERCKDPQGFIEHVPKTFLRSGCKSVEEALGDGMLRIRYIYNDKLDLVLIVNPTDGRVVTNWLRIADNKGVYKGRFYVQPVLTKKSKK